MITIDDLRAVSHGFESQKSQWWWREGRLTLIRSWTPTKSPRLLPKEKTPRPHTGINYVEITPRPHTGINYVECKRKQKILIEF